MLLTSKKRYSHLMLKKSSRRVIRFYSQQGIFISFTSFINGRSRRFFGARQLGACLLSHKTSHSITGSNISYVIRVRDHVCISLHITLADECDNNCG